MTFVLLYFMIGASYAASKFYIMRDEDMFTTLRPWGMPHGLFLFAVGVAMILMAVLWPLFLLGDGLEWLHNRWRHGHDADDDGQKEQD